MTKSVKSSEWRTGVPSEPLDEAFVTIMSWRGEPYVCEASWDGERWFIESRGFLDMGAGEHEPEDILAWHPMLEPYAPTTRPRTQWHGAVIVDVEYLCANGNHEKLHFIADLRDPDHLFEEIVQAKESLGAEWVWCS